MMSSRACSVFFFLLLAFSGYFDSCPSAVAGPTSFDFSSFNLQNLTFHGNSYVREGIIGLTGGAVVYNDPIFLFDPSANTSFSFSTQFTFFIGNVNAESFEDRLAFFLSPTNHTLGFRGRFLGLNTNESVVVEFRTRQDLILNDLSGNHVGLDLSSMVSFKTADPILQGIDLKSGKWITSWIDYNSSLKNLQVFLSYSNAKPPNPILGVDDIDLSDILKGELFVGFSASTEGSVNLHLIKYWSFEKFDFYPTRSSSPPLTVSVSGTSSVTAIGVGIPEKETRKKHQRKLELGVAIAGAAVFCAILSVVGFVSLRKRRNVAKQRTFTTELVACPKEFSYIELKSATRGFHSSRIIGSGSFGIVYKAFFSSSRTIAVVKRSRLTHEDKIEFQARLSIIAGLRHKNLVQLQGWCVERGELLLVYGFIPHGSLEDVLYQESEVLSWTHRRNILIGVASVLTYLHEVCEHRVFHGDIKTTNILLDGNLNPRLDDFGLAKPMDHDDKSHVFSSGKATQATDVYSYGLLVLEVACGRRLIEKQGQMILNLVDWVWELYSQGKIMEAADRRLNAVFEEDEMRKVLLLGLSCANPNNAERPSMTRVLQIMNNEAEPPAVKNIYKSFKLRGHPK